MADEMKNEGEDGTAAPAETINIVVRDQHQGEVHFKVKPHTKFAKVISAYCSKKGVAAEQLRFLYDGDAIRQDQSPSDLNMDDGDIVDAVAQQTGGQ